VTEWLADGAEPRAAASASPHAGVTFSVTCDRCGKPAVVHEVRVSGGKHHEVHLCEEHAREAGFAIPSPQQVPKLVGEIMAAAASSISRSRQVKALQACATCKLSFHQFKQRGLLGCGDCYKAFAEALAILIERTQNAGVHHVGKVPRRGGPGTSAVVDLGPLRARLNRELAEAVKAEQYERAARIRDRLRSLESAGVCDAEAAEAAARSKSSAPAGPAAPERGGPRVEGA